MPVTTRLPFSHNALTLALTLIAPTFIHTHRGRCGFSGVWTFWHPYICSLVVFTWDLLSTQDLSPHAVYVNVSYN